jgi:hypothetical protein
MPDRIAVIGLEQDESAIAPHGPFLIAGELQKLIGLAHAQVDVDAFPRRVLQVAQWLAVEELGFRRDPESAKRRTGRPRKLSPEQVEVLVSLVRDNPLLSLDDAVSVFRRKTGITLSTATIRKYLHEASRDRNQVG